MVSSTMMEYFTDAWNIIDLVSILGFSIGFLLRRASGWPLPGLAGFPTDDRGFPDSDIEVGINDEWAGITWWKFFYGLSLFALVLRSLRILSVFRSLGLLVIVTFRMMR